MPRRRMGQTTTLKEAGIRKKANRQRIRRQVKAGKKVGNKRFRSLGEVQRQAIKRKITRNIKRRSSSKAMSAAEKLKKKSDALRSIPRMSRDGPR